MSIRLFHGRCEDEIIKQSGEYHRIATSRLQIQNHDHVRPEMPSAP